MSPVESLRHSSFRIRDRLLVNLLSEFLGTFLLVLIGCSSIAQFILSEAKLNNHLQVLNLNRVGPLYKILPLNKPQYKQRF